MQKHKMTLNLGEDFETLFPTSKVGGAGLGADPIPEPEAQEETILMIGGNAFVGQNPDTDQVTIDEESGNIQVDQTAVTLLLSISLPHGATITSVIVDGTAAGETWTLVRNDQDGGSPDIMASANIGSSDTSISFPIIDNNNKFYFIVTSTLDSTDLINSAKITYKTEFGST